VSRHRSPLFDTQPSPASALPLPGADRVRSLSTQIIYRGHRSAGYGFVAFNTLEAAEKAAELLNKKELDGRSVIIEIAKPAEEKQKEKSERKPIKKRVPKKVKAVAAAAADALAPAKDDSDETSAAEKTEGEAKPKKKRNIVSPSLRYFHYLSLKWNHLSAQAQED